MISTLTGRIAALGLDSLVLDVGGVGFAIRTTPQTVTATRIGQEIMLHTELVVREDSLTLYGFLQREEADIFQVVQSVSGIGPRTALGLLAVLTPQELFRAVAEQDTKTISRAPGVGPKVASRMILELGGKLPAPAESDTGADGAVASGTDSAGAAPSSADRLRATVTAALTGLSFAEKAAATAVDRAAEELGEDADDTTLLRAALRRLGGSR